MYRDPLSSRVYKSRINFAVTSAFSRVGVGFSGLRELYDSETLDHVVDVCQFLLSSIVVPFEYLESFNRVGKSDSSTSPNNLSPIFEMGYEDLDYSSAHST